MGTRTQELMFWWEFLISILPIGPYCQALWAWTSQWDLPFSCMFWVDFVFDDSVLKVGSLLSYKAPLQPKLILICKHSCHKANVKMDISLKEKSMKWYTVLSTNHEALLYYGHNSGNIASWNLTKMYHEIISRQIKCNKISVGLV